MNFELSADELVRIQSWVEQKDSTRRAIYHWPSQFKSRELPAGIANILIVPGLGEHAGRYAESAVFFANQGFAVFAIDLIGHGLSPGMRGCIKSYAGLMEELETAMQFVSEKNPNLPLVMWGHSMGGNLVLNYLLRSARLPVCAIVSGPMLRATNLPSNVFLWFARLCGRLLPNYRISAPVRTADCTRDPRQQALMQSDRLYHKLISLRLGAELIDSGEWALRHAEQLTTQVLLLHSQQDAITSAIASEEFAGRSEGCCDLRLLPNQMHDVHRDLGSEAVLQLMVDWLRSKIADNY